MFVINGQITGGCYYEGRDDQLEECGIFGSMNVREFPYLDDPEAPFWDIAHSVGISPSDCFVCY